VPTRANRQPALAIFLLGRDGEPEPLGIAVLRVVDGLIAEIDAFLDPTLPARFGITAPA
jgi:RNA polymerase sigma-70 factor (ECF subfamily)